MNISDIQRRTERAAEATENQGPRDVCLNVVYVETIETAEGRKEVPIPAEYDPVNRETIEPNSGGTRIVVRYPRFEKTAMRNRKAT